MTTKENKAASGALLPGRVKLKRGGRNFKEKPPPRLALAQTSSYIASCLCLRRLPKGKLALLARVSSNQRKVSVRVPLVGPTWSSYV